MCTADSSEVSSRGVGRYLRAFAAFGGVPARKSAGAFPWVRLQEQDFDVAEALRRVSRPDCGAQLVYVGTVRATPHGGGRKKVVRLEYEAFARMAQAKLAAVRREALRRFEIKELLLHHRIGRFRTGQNVVMLAVSAPHRDEALAAAAWAISEMKQTVP